MVENWNQYKDLEYYSHLCGCECGGRIEVKPHHKYNGIPKYIKGHGKTGKIFVPREIRFCGCGCGKFKEVLVTSTWQCFRGHNTGEKQIQAMREANIGRKHSSEEIEKTRTATREKWADSVWRENQCRSLSEGRRNSEKVEKLRKNPEYRRKLSIATSQFWQDPKRKKKRLAAIFKGLNLLPNKPEKFLDKLFQQLFPNQIKYTGDGKDEDSIVAGKCPDFIFIDGQKKIIEFFGDYWHGEGRTGIPNEQHEQQRIDCFAKYGYQTLVIWEHELEDIDAITNRFTEFCSEGVYK